jgi:hypothetical protein
MACAELRARTLTCRVHGKPGESAASRVVRDVAAAAGEAAAVRAAGRIAVAPRVGFRPDGILRHGVSVLDMRSAVHLCFVQRYFTRRHMAGSAPRRRRLRLSWATLLPRQAPMTHPESHPPFATPVPVSLFRIPCRCEHRGGRAGRMVCACAACVEVRTFLKLRSDYKSTSIPIIAAAGGGSLLVERPVVYRTPSCAHIYSTLLPEYPTALVS